MDIFNLDEFENNFQSKEQNENKNEENDNKIFDPFKLIKIKSNPNQNFNNNNNNKNISKIQKIYNENFAQNEEESEEEFYEEEEEDYKFNNLINDMVKENEIFEEEEEENEEEKEIEEKKDSNINENDNNNNNNNNIESPQIYAIEDEINVSEFSKISPLAINYPFELDDFQKRSIIRLERHQNVLVCAHTSSGKTVVAEYGIALGKHKSNRVLYTSPIKALSNQKYRDFKKKFGDVGILTGDVSLNPDAQCLIMTTEILQQSLYKNSELLNSVEWVIFDEVHYINDNERGHVWEEILILLPQNIGLIMLSATVPNYLEFAKWVGQIKKTVIYIENTLKRVVPLEHFLFLDKNNIFLAKDKDNNIYKDNIAKAIKQLDNLRVQNKGKKDKKKKEQEFIDNINWYEQFKNKKKQNKFNKKNNQNYQKGFKNYNDGKPKITKTHYKIDEIVDFLVFKKEFTPAVIFVFSIKRITEYAKMLSNTEFVPASQSHKIVSFFNTCINKVLPPEDVNIPQIQETREILKSGIGIHHSGLLPILKEIIEILYSKNLLKILFATTSFSIGLNMPTKTVVFTEIYKFNEDHKEILTSSEYLQMCGRAGRRGIDEVGEVYILLMDPVYKNEDDDIFEMLTKIGTNVESKFRLSYKTIITFFSRNLKKIEEFFKESFLESLNAQNIPKIMGEIHTLKSDSEQILGTISCSKTNDVEFIKTHFELYSQLEYLNNSIFVDDFFKQTLDCCGRIIKVFDFDDLCEKTVIVIRYYDDYNNEIWTLDLKKANNLIIYEEEIKSKNKKKNNENLELKKEGKYKHYFFKYKDYFKKNIIEIYNNTINIKIHNFNEDKNGYLFFNLKDLHYIYKEFERLKNSENLTPIDYTKKLMNQLEFSTDIEKRQEILSKIEQSPCKNCTLFKTHFKTFAKFHEKDTELKEKEKNLNPENLQHYKEFDLRLKILKKMDFVDKDNQVTLKGKAAREISTTDCLIVSELLLSNILEKLSDNEIVGFISGFCSNKNEIDFTLNDKFTKNFLIAVDEFKKIYDKIVENEKSFEFEDNKYDRRITFAISKAMISWMEGKNFNEILQETELEEGKLYNLIMRIYLFLEECINFYGTLGNLTLNEKFTKIKSNLLRGIMAIQSLYLQDNINIDIEREGD